MSRTLPLVAALVGLACLAAPVGVSASSRPRLLVSCPEGKQTIFLYGYGFFTPNFDLFAGLSKDIPRITVCTRSGFASYRKFTRDELVRIADLMDTDAYRTRAKTLTRGALALWVERQIAGAVDPRLEYRLRLHDAYHGIEGDATDPDIQNARYRAILPVIRDGYEASSSAPVDHVRAQLQIAILSRKLGKAGAVDWFERAVAGQKALSDPEEEGISADERSLRLRQYSQYRRLPANIAGIGLCIRAPGDLVQELCEGTPDARNIANSYHGIERLANWAFRGPIDPDSTAEEDRLRDRLKDLQKRDDDWAREQEIEIAATLSGGPQYFRDKALAEQATMAAIQRERKRDTVFREQFDRHFLQGVRTAARPTMQSPSYYYCDLIELRVSIGKRCWIDETPAWAEAHRRFPGIMAELREESRQEALSFAAMRSLAGDEQSRAVTWARDQESFDAALVDALPRYLEDAARSAGANSAECDLGAACETPSSFEAAMRQLPDGNDAGSYRDVFDSARDSRFSSEIRPLAWCDVRIALGSTYTSNCLEGDARDDRVLLLRSLVDVFDETYAEARKYNLEWKARDYGRGLAHEEFGRPFEPTHDRATLEALLPEAGRLIEESYAMTLQNLTENVPVRTYPDRTTE